MTVLAPVLYVVALVVLFGVRSWLHHRRTGRAGFHGVSGTPRQAGWWGGVLFVAAVVLGLAAALLAATGAVSVGAPGWVRVLGLVVALLGFAATVIAQTGMGSSWRIGVDTTERTDLVTTGVFAHVRNPIFTAMTLAQVGMFFMVPTVLSAAALITLVVAVQLQVRAVEEPYLAQVHDERYRAYAAKAGRFVPGVGQMHQNRVSPPTSG
jgi:protein-S-isoprenylcysteine O-methyltransferase Ste14